ncbi:hypothetical protein, partial [Nereida ignava]|uniref:hypothetical protein n=1 Tax=Nereida ignava TaxID=282199 RepID=UPI002FE2986A
MGEVEISSAPSIFGMFSAANSVMPAIQLKPWNATTMTASVTSAAKPQKTRSIPKAMLRQRSAKNE